MLRWRALSSPAGNLLPLTILVAAALLLAGVVCGLAVRIALLYVQTSQLADAAAVKAANRSAIGLNGCAHVLSQLEPRAYSCSDNGSEVHVVLKRAAKLLWGEVEVFGQARIGYLKIGSGG